MAGRLGDLAARMKAAVEESEKEQQERLAREQREAAERENAAAEARARREADERARGEMMSEIAAFSSALGFAEVTADLPRAVQLAWQGRKLAFHAGTGDRIDVSGTGTEVYLRRDSAAEWEVVISEGDVSRRLPLELGLEELLGAGLGVPRGRRGVRVELAAPATVPPPKTKAPAKAAEPAKTAAAGKKEPMMPGSSVKPYKGPLDT